MGGNVVIFSVLTLNAQRQAAGVGDFMPLMRLLWIYIGYLSGWIERGDELTIAIAYNNQLSALEYSSCVDLRLFFRLSYVV